MASLAFATSNAAVGELSCSVSARKSSVEASRVSLAASSPQKFGEFSGLKSSSATITAAEPTLLLAVNQHLSLPSESRRHLHVVCATRQQGDLAEKMKAMAAAERRWEAQVVEGRVKPLSAKEAGYAFQLADHVLLDVRPLYERKKSWVKGSVWVPAFDEDRTGSPGVLFEILSTFMMGGWWSGVTVTKLNERFMADIVAQIPKNANVIVACQKGLRSLAACEQLYKAGYRNLFWLNGGFDSCTEEDFPREGQEQLSFAGIGGMSEFLGWTDQQRRRAAKEGLGYRAQFALRLAAVILAVDLFFVGAQQLSEFLQKQ
eukprot:TRINITY_DN1066_c0_g1_i1.p1 TRINITY_DN1066_c0_g1~~TRINITY_DN1066_c0_g1_i1.p1  ORF type:complete len:330 (+),score=91.11 TRINITY_DN1066_c0_g1_i1:40-990(+)